MPAAIPKRLTWAADLLGVESDDRILEIGCGRGVAIELLCGQLGKGHITGIDRSSTAIAAAKSRLQQCLRSGKVELLNSALADAEFSSRFDKVFAVNVNAFWLKPARELAVVRKALAPRGKFYLFYEPPSPSQLERARGACVGFLKEAGLKVVNTATASLSPGVGLCIVAGHERTVR